VSEDASLGLVVVTAVLAVLVLVARWMARHLISRYAAARRGEPPPETLEAETEVAETTPLRPRQAHRLMAVYMLAVVLLAFGAMALALYLQTRGVGF